MMERSPDKQGQQIVKRVIAREGDIVIPRNADRPPVLIPQGHCWVEGDNADTSSDSNRYGPVSIQSNIYT